MPVRLPQTQIDFIFQNKDKMKQADIARKLKVWPSTVNMILRGKRGSYKPE